MVTISDAIKHMGLDEEFTEWSKSNFGSQAEFMRAKYPNRLDEFNNLLGSNEIAPQPNDNTSQNTNEPASAEEVLNIDATDQSEDDNTLQYNGKDLSQMGSDVVNAYNEWKKSNKDGTIEQFFNTAGKEYYEKYKETITKIDNDIISQEIDFDKAADDDVLKEAMGNLTSFSFIDEDGNKDEEISKLFYELAQNETYADCMDEKSTDKYKDHLKGNLEKINEELILNQLIFENYKDVDFAGLSDKKREELKNNLGDKYQEAKTKFGQGKFIIDPEVATATMAVHSHNLQPRAQHYEKFGIKTLWNKIKEFDSKAAKKFPKLYPLAKNMLINGTAGMVAGPLGLAVVSAGKTAIEVYKIHKQAKAQGKSLGEYLKENKDVAIRLGFQVAGAAVTAVIGVQAVNAGSIGMIHHGSFKTGFGARLARAAAAVGAGAASSAGQFKKGNFKKGFKALGLTTLAAGAGLVLGEHGSEWVHKIFGGHEPQVDTISGADANQIDQTTPTAELHEKILHDHREFTTDPLTHMQTPVEQPEGWHTPMAPGFDPNAPMERTPATSLDDNQTSVSHAAPVPEQPSVPHVDEPTLGDNATQAGVDAAAMVQDAVDQAEKAAADEIANRLEEQVAQQHIDPLTLDVPQESPIEPLEQTIADLQGENTVEEPIAQHIPLDEVKITADRVTPENIPAVPDNEAFALNNSNLNENSSSIDGGEIGQELKDSIMRGSTNAYTDAAHPLHEPINQPEQAFVQTETAEHLSEATIEEDIKLGDEKLILGSEQDYSANSGIQPAVEPVATPPYVSEVADVTMPEGKLDDYGDAYVGRLPEGYSYANGVNTMGDAGVVAQNADILDENQQPVAHQEIVKVNDHTKVVSTTNLETNEVTAVKIVDGKVVEANSVDANGNQTNLSHFDKNGNVTHRITPNSEYNAEYNDQQQLVHSEKTTQLSNGHIREEEYNLENSERTTIVRDGNEILSKTHTLTDEKGITCTTEDKGAIHRESQFKDDKPLFEEYTNNATGAHSDTNYQYNGDKLTHIEHSTNGIKGDISYSSDLQYNGDKLTGEITKYGNDGSTLKTSYGYNEGENTPSSMTIEAKDASGKLTEKYEVDMKTGAWKHFDANGELKEQGGYVEETTPAKSAIPHKSAQVETPKTEDAGKTTPTDLKNPLGLAAQNGYLLGGNGEAQGWHPPMASGYDPNAATDSAAHTPDAHKAGIGKGWIIGGSAVAVGGAAWLITHKIKKNKEDARRLRKVQGIEGQSDATYEPKNGSKATKKSAINVNGYGGNQGNG